MSPFPSAFSVLAFCALVPVFGAVCPSKLSPRLCPLFAAAPDTAYLQVRIALDPKVEDGFAWDKKFPPGSAPSRPLRAYSESLIVKYDLRQPAHPESAYVRLYGENDPNPSIEQVMFHRVSVTRANLGAMMAETYLTGAEALCPANIHASVCAEINGRSDSDTLEFGIMFWEGPPTDSVEGAAFLSRYGTRAEYWAHGNCFGTRFFATPSSILAMAEAPEVQAIRSSSLVCLVSAVQPPSRADRASRLRPTSLSEWRLDGRKIPRGRPRNSRLP